MEKKHCLKRRVLFCLLYQAEIWVFIRAIEPREGKYLDAIDLSAFLEEKLGRRDQKDCWAMAKAMPRMNQDQCVAVFYEDDDPNCPVIHPDDLGIWFKRAFPELCAGKASA